MNLSQDFHSFYFLNPPSKSPKDYGMRGSTINNALPCSTNNIGKPLMHFDKLLAIHHTTSYINYEKFIMLIKIKTFQYYGVLIRSHYLEWTFWGYFLRARYSLISFVISLVFSFFNIYVIWVLYFVIQIIRVILSHNKNESLISNFFFKLMNDLFCFWGIFSFFPKAKKYKISEIQNNKI